MHYVYVLDKSGSPLMPTTRYGKVRRMLKDGRAVAVRTKPFTIRLTYEPETHVTQPVTLGIDPGRTNIGLAAVREDGKCLYSAKCETRNREVPGLMRERRGHRQASRRGERLRRKRRAKASGSIMACGETRRLLPGCSEPVTVKGIINTESRFNNRKRPDGWLTPTATQLLRTHVNLVRLVRKVLPVSGVVLELNKFAFMQLDSPGIKKCDIDFRHGPLYGKSGPEAAVSELQDGHCLFCGKPIENYHHIVPRSKGGSDTMTNLAGLCSRHHELVHKEEKWHARMLSKKAGLHKKYGALSVLNQIIPRLVEELAGMFPGNAHVTNGWNTKAFRDAHDIAKDHDEDAYCIAISAIAPIDDKSACSALSSQTAFDAPSGGFLIRQFRRHDRALIKSQRERAYRLDGTVVARNRRKRMDQKEPSLHEWLAETEARIGRDGARRLLSALDVTKSTRYYNRPGRPMPGCVFMHEGQRYVMSGQLSGGAYLRACSAGSRNFPTRDVRMLSRNAGLVYIA